MSLPTVGRIVHYQSFGTPKGEYQSLARAAIVTAVREDGRVSVCILNPTGIFFTEGLEEAPSDAPRAGCWNWPPRVESAQ